MASVMFSDDEDVSRHAAELDQVHDNLIYSEKCSPNFLALDDSKENQPKSAFGLSIETDPICRRILAEKRRPFGDVFILPMVKPARGGDEYAFSNSDSEKSKGPVTHLRTLNRSKERTQSVKASPAGQRLLDACSMKSSPASLLNTPRLSYRKKARLRRLFHAGIETQQSQSDDDQDFIPSLSISEYESLLREKPRLEMDLRPRKGGLCERIARSTECERNSSVKNRQPSVCRNQGLSGRRRHIDSDSEPDEPLINFTRRNMGQSFVCRNQGPLGSRRHIDSDSELDEPLLSFTRSGRDRKRKWSQRSERKLHSTVHSSSDDNCSISDDDVPLSVIKRHCTLRSRKQVDYSDMDYTS
uniref:G patch domain-containing protein 2-like n=1 Tax=Haemonchus contortus TaxID=6289 RepID=A0A7I4XWJ3_HAECO